jgi:hypothetical protein
LKLNEDLVDKFLTASKAIIMMRLLSHAKLQEGMLLKLRASGESFKLTTTCS